MTQAEDITDFTMLLQRVHTGDSAAENQLFELIDHELRRIAARLSPDGRMARATSLVNEAYIYLFDRVKNKKNLDLRNRQYFFVAIANRMRNVLIDRYRRSRPGQWDPALDQVLEEMTRQTNWDYEALHEVLEEFLRSDDPRKRRRHQLINLHFFCGMTYTSAAVELGISPSQYQIDRDRALAELQQAITKRQP